MICSLFMTLGRWMINNDMLLIYHVGEVDDCKARIIYFSTEIMGGVFNFYVIFDCGIKLYYSNIK